MSAMLRGTSASTQARNVMRSLPPRTGRAVLESMARPQTLVETVARNRNERRAHEAALRRRVHEHADSNAALPIDIEDRPSGIPSKFMGNHLTRPIHTPTRMISYAHHFLGARTELAGMSKSPVFSVQSPEERAAFVLRMHGVEVL
jgi:hypothetical protein